MTTEEKAKRYDEVLENIKELYSKGSRVVVSKEEFENIFPELAELEDELTWLTNYIQEEAYNLSMDIRDGEDRVKLKKLQRSLAWLEKQGEQKVNSTTLVETGNGGINALVTRELPTNSCNDANYCSDCINKKGCINCENEDMKETEHKVKSKFKVGDWIACKELNTALIVNVYDDKYEVEFIDGNKGFPHINYVDRFFHLWTIADAKPEDVLLSKHNQPFIYNGIFDEESIGAYCGIDKLGNDFLIDAFSCDWSYKEGVKPATKEQRDFLFQKMKESSYEWDNEKKEVKKIVPIFNVGDIIAKKHNSDINKFGQFTITDVSNGKYWYDESIICDITEQDDWELVEQKSAKWSKEDDKMLDKIINALIGAKNVDCADYSIMYDWLNLIEQRIEV